MKRRASGGRRQEALFPNERAEPVRAEGTRELVRALADLMLEALGRVAREGGVNESEDHD
jgi:hypothetical protein